jgi:hypothetical protein
MKPAGKQMNAKSINSWAAIPAVKGFRAPAMTDRTGSFLAALSIRAAFHQLLYPDMCVL